MRKLLAFFFLALAGPAFAQFAPGTLLTAAQLNTQFALYTPLAGGTLTGPLTVPSLTVTTGATIANPAITGGTITGLSAPIPLGSGGTGATTQSAALTSILGSSTVPITNGGTGSTSITAPGGAFDTLCSSTIGQMWVRLTGAWGCSSLGFTNPVWYGADATGATDSTSAFNSALSASRALFVPAGTFNLSSLSITNPTTITCAGPGATVLRETNATGDLITVNANQVILEGCGFNSSVTRTAGSFVTMPASQSQITLRDFYMTGHYIGVHLTCAAECRVQSGTMFGGATAAGATGILVDGGNDQYINQVTMDAPAGSQPPSGIQITSTGALNLTDDDVIRHTNDLLINPGNGQTVASVWVENSYFDTATNGIYIAPTGTGNVVRARFIGTWTSSHSSTGIIIGPPGTGTLDGIEFIGHHAFGNTSNAVSLLGGTNLRFLGGAYTGNTAGSGFSVAAGVSGWSIEGAKIGSGFGFGGNTFGVYINPGASDNWALIGDDMRGNSSAAISDNSTGTHKLIKSNLGLNPIGSTSITVTASPFTYTNSTGDTVNVFVTGGTVSSVTLGGNTVATATNTVVPVPQGASVVVTYSSAPTMTYIGN